MGGCRVRLQADGRFKMLDGLRVLCFCSVDQAEKLLRIEAARHAGKQRLELSCSLGILPGMVLAYRGLKLLVQTLAVLGERGRCAGEEKGENHQRKAWYLAHESLVDAA
jgi:hypothetical protein